MISAGIPFVLLAGICLFNLRVAANEVLLFYDAEFHLGPSRYQNALDNRGYPYQVFEDVGSFSTAVQSADPATDVVVLDLINFSYNLNSVRTFVQAGGRALVQYWDLGSDNSLATALDVNLSQLNAGVVPPSPHDWGGSPLFDGVTTRLSLTSLSALAYTHGYKLQPLAGGQAVAGFVPSPTANEAALVIGNSGRTIVQGFIAEEIELVEEAAQFIENELDYLFGPIAPASAPSITEDPRTQTVLTNFCVDLRVKAAGSLPLSYQWQKDGTNLLGATNAVYLVTNAQPADMGAYTVTVTNQLGSATSAAALLTVTDPGPIANIVLLVEDGTYPSPYESALLGLDLVYQKHSDGSNFNAAIVLADPGNTLVILDAYNNPLRYSELVGFVKAGGRVLMQIWNLLPDTHLAEAFDVSVVQQNSTILPVHDWTGSEFFAGLSTPLTLGPLSPSLLVHGQTLQPLAGGQAVAGYITSPTADEAAIVIGNSAHTIVNGFTLEEAVSSAEGVQFARNQVLHFYPLRFEAIGVAGSIVTLTWTAIPSQDYLVQYKESAAQVSWSDLGSPLTAVDTTASTTDVITDGNSRIYRVQLLP